MPIPKRTSLLACFLLFSSGSIAQESIAILGEPFGVGRVRVTWPQPTEGDFHVSITSPDGQVFYPATIPETVRISEPLQVDPPLRELKFGRGKIIERLGQVVKAAATTEESMQTVGHEVHFLFHGDGPFQLKIAGPTVITTTVRPLPAQPDVRSAILQDWWTAFQVDAEQRIASDVYQPVLDAYLLSTLAKRLNLPPSAALSRLRLEQVPSAIEMMADSKGVQRVALAMSLRDRDAVDFAPMTDLQVFPPPPAIEPLADDKGPPGIETIARFAPPECFYLRFANFANFLWFQKLAQEHDGNIQNMFSSPVLEQSVGARIEELLNVRYTELADLMGDQLIRDVAVVGTDLLANDGPSIGVLLRAKSGFLLSTFMETDRKQTAAKFADCTLETVVIEGIDVSLLSTPDNRIRSFWIKNGDWFLVTSSQHLAMRFIEARKSRQTLAATAEFQAFRAAYPAGDADPISIYLPSRFLENLYSPRFQVESLRRCQSIADMALLQVARQCAMSEGLRLQDTEALEAAGFLPSGFGRRSDEGSVSVAEDRSLDSRRGMRGSMLPISDTTIEQISPAERLWQDQSLRHLRDHTQQSEPIFIQLTREPSLDGDPNVEKLRIQLDASPVLLGKHAWLIDELGSASDIHIRHASDDLVTFQAHITTKRLGGTIPPHHLFGGIKDCNPVDLEQFQSPLQRIFALSSIRGYLAAWPEPGLVDRLPLGLGRGTPVGPKTTRLVGGAYRYQSDRVSLLSFHPDVLTDSVPQLAVLDGGPPASAKLQIKYLRGTSLEAWANEALLASEEIKSRAGSDLLNRLGAQLRIDPANAPVFAEQLLGAIPQCALGGHYAIDPHDRWVSDFDGRDNATLAPIMRWFGGMEATLIVANYRIQADVEVTILRAGSEKPRPQRKRASL